jgi:hypothetical protein
VPIEINKVIYATPFGKLFRALTDKERNSLHESINSFWVRMPVVVYRSVAHGDSIIDGANRSELAYRVDPNRQVPVTDLGEIPDNVAEELARTLNVDRRHLSSEDYQRLSAERVARMKRIATLRIGGKSLRDIAHVENISHEQVRKDWQRATCQSVLTTDEEEETEEQKEEDFPLSSPYVVGRDGKSYPAAAPRRAEPADEEILEGLEVPSQRDAIFEKLSRIFDEMRRELAALKELDEPMRKRDKQVLIRARNDITAALKRKPAGKRA